MHLLELFCLAVRLADLRNVFRVNYYELFVYVNLVAGNNIFAALALKERVSLSCKMAL